MRLRCPFGKSGESSTDWSRHSPKWNECVSNGERERLAPHQLAEGEFYLSFNDFVDTFTQIESVHLDTETSRDEPTLQGKGFISHFMIFLFLNVCDSITAAMLFPIMERISPLLINLVAWNSNITGVLTFY